MRTKTKTAFAVFTKTDTGKDYLVKGNFGSDEAQANGWADYHGSDVDMKYNEVRAVMNGGSLHITVPRYPNGLFVKKVNY